MVDIFDKFFQKYSYKFDKGYPDMSNPNDVALLEEILLNNFNISVKTSNTNLYDNVIKNALKVSDIPLVKGNYILGESVTLNNEDAEIFKTLYGIAPPKKNEEIGEAASKSYGNGELALYWLFKYQTPSYIVETTKGGDNPDLKINGIGIEIKAYKDINNIPVGRTGKYTESLNDLNTILGIGTLMTDFQAEGNKLTPPNAFNVNVKELKEACKHALDIFKEESLLKESAEVFNIKFLQSTLNKLNELKSRHPINDENALTASLLRSFIIQKFSIKPGLSGYIVNINENNKIDYIKIDENIINNINDEQVLNNAQLKQGVLVFNINLFT